MPPRAAVARTAPKSRHLSAVPAAPHHTDPDVAATHAQTLDQGALTCREFSHHAWKSAKVTPRRWGFERLNRCRDCGAQYKEDLDQWARPLKKYPPSYPEGYLLPKGSGRLDADGRAAYRLESLKRTI
jgi:hypothetical protein